MQKKTLDLLNLLIEDEKKARRDLYSSGPYWSYKNRKTNSQIRKFGINNFRGIQTGVGTSFTDNLTSDMRNECNTKQRFLFQFLTGLPFIKSIHEQQVHLTKSYIHDFLTHQSIAYQNSERVNFLLNKYEFGDSLAFDCIQKFTSDKKEYSCHYADMANRLNHLETKFNFEKTRSFFEIGGGFGAFVHFLLNNFNTVKKVIYLDVVPNIFVGTEYLRYFYPEAVKDYADTYKQDTISFSDNDDLEIICIPPWEIEKLEGSIDHFHNASSFVEMPENIVKNYARFIKGLDVKEISLISYDNYDLKTTFDPHILTELFDKNFQIDYFPMAIEALNRKEVYITS